MRKRKSDTETTSISKKHLSFTVTYANTSDAPAPTDNPFWKKLEKDVEEFITRRIQDMSEDRISDTPDPTLYGRIKTIVLELNPKSPLFVTPGEPKSDVSEAATLALLYKYLYAGKYISETHTILKKKLDMEGVVTVPLKFPKKLNKRAKDAIRSRLLFVVRNPEQSLYLFIVSCRLATAGMSPGSIHRFSMEMDHYGSAFHNASLTHIVHDSWWNKFSDRRLADEIKLYVHDIARSIASEYKPPAHLEKARWPDVQRYMQSKAVYQSWMVEEAHLAIFRLLNPKYTTGQIRMILNAMSEEFPQL